MALRRLRGHPDRHLDTWHTPRIDLALPRASVPVLLDGDVIRLEAPTVVESVRDAVLVFGVPPVAG